MYVVLNIEIFIIPFGLCVLDGADSKTDCSRRDFARGNGMVRNDDACTTLPSGLKFGFDNAVYLTFPFRSDHYRSDQTENK